MTSNHPLLVDALLLFIRAMCISRALSCRLFGLPSSLDESVDSVASAVLATDFDSSLPLSYLAIIFSSSSVSLPSNLNMTTSSLSTFAGSCSCNILSTRYLMRATLFGSFFFLSGVSVALRSLFLSEALPLEDGGDGCIKPDGLCEGIVFRGEAYAFRVPLVGEGIRDCIIWLRRSLIFSSLSCSFVERRSVFGWKIVFSLPSFCWTSRDSCSCSTLFMSLCTCCSCSS
mmetsp:Transcript_23199/g.37817  ORF Transcript_23199/g.37817 Transcript_23199/m.37817 type:complete len:229 (-) Transcript_23199:646-1332(-)